MPANYSNIPMAELVDLLSQKTQIFTQLLTNKKFGQEYGECKEAIQQIIAEIERRKEDAVNDKELQATSDSNS